VPLAGEGQGGRRRWGTLAEAVQLLAVVPIAVAWIDALAGPDTRHVHVGAVLQQTNDVATPEQQAAARQLYDATAAAIAPYRDWHSAWDAGFRPGGSQSLPSTHWMNQRNVDAGYV